jgi:hypothetical protein
MASKFLVKNMGRLDRALRAFLFAPAAVVAALALDPSSIAAIVLFAVAAIALITGASGRCPNYVLFGIDTRDRGHMRTPLTH